MNFGILKWEYNFKGHWFLFKNITSWFFLVKAYFHSHFHLMSENAHTGRVCANTREVTRHWMHLMSKEVKVTGILRPNFFCHTKRRQSQLWLTFFQVITLSISYYPSRKDTLAKKVLHSLQFSCLKSEREGRRVESTYLLFSWTLTDVALYVYFGYQKQVTLETLLFL